MNTSALFEKQNIVKTLGAAGGLTGLAFAVMKRKKLPMTAIFIIAGAVIGTVVGRAVQKS